MKFSLRFLQAVLLGLCFATLSGQRGFSSEATPPEEGMITYLGVSTFHLSPSLREHLEIEDGFGIQVKEVLPESPAEVAGLKTNDILIQFGDQLLISPEHLSLLVKRKPAESSVEIQVIRKGAKENLEVTLGRIASDDPSIRSKGGPTGRSTEEWQRYLKDQQDHWQRLLEKRGAVSATPPGSEKANRPPPISLNPGFPVRVLGSDGVIKIDNNEGEVVITREEEGHSIIIKDPSGEEIFSGPYDATAGIEALPEEAKEHLEKMKLDNLQILAPQIANEAPEKTSQPMPPIASGDQEDLL